jgi:hypothetical protein
MAGESEGVDMTDKPKTLKAAIELLKVERASLSLTLERKEKMQDERDTAQRLQRNAEASEKQAREQFADLKKKLYDAEIELARLRGFVERVREDDAVADPLVEVEDAQGRRQVTKRFPSNRPLNADMYTGMAEAVQYGRYGERQEKPKHWTSY